jgi:molybdate transport system substrate-binding protein
VPLLALALLASVVAGCGSGSADAGRSLEAGGPVREVRVAAASDLNFALKELQPLLDAAHPGVRLKVTYGSSGTFLQQITEGAPFDVFLSADLAFPQRLADDGLANPEDLFEYAVGRLVVWTPEGSEVDPAPGLSVLTDPRVRKVAIANPEHAPYGRAAVAAMRTTGVYDEVAPKFVLGESVSQAAEFVQSGGADAGVVAMSLVLSDPLREQGRWVEVPLTDFPQLLQGGVVLSKAADPEAARAVGETLLSEPGRELLRRYGFFLPGAV